MLDQPIAYDLRAFRFSLDPTADQRADLVRHVGAARWAFNHALARKVAAHEQWRTEVQALVVSGVDEADARRQVKVPIPTMPTIQHELKAIRGDDRAGVDGLCPWWREVSSYAFLSAMMDADAAFANWLASLRGVRAGRRVGYPRFKRKGKSRDSVRLYHNAKKPTIRLVGYRRLLLPRIGSVRLHESGKRLARYLQRTAGRVQSVTLSRTGTRWYASVLVKAPAPAPVVPTRAQRAAGTVGVDLGVGRLATLSTGLEHSYENPRHARRAARRLVRAQRALSRTQRGSGRRARAITRVADLHRQVSERRAGVLHQITKRLATGHDVVAIEDLNVAGMTRSAKGTIDNPGKNVRAKAGLNRSLADASFGEFRRQLTYKTGWYGSRLAVVDRFYPSSKTCSACGSVKPKLTLAERTFRCACGLVIDRDLNAAINIARAADAPPAAPVAADRAETINGRGVRGRPTSNGGRRTAKRQDSGKPEPPRGSDSAALPPVPLS